MSIIVLLCLLFGVAAILMLVLFLLQRRQLNALETVSRQVQRIAGGGSLKKHIELHTDQPELANLVDGREPPARRGLPRRATASRPAVRRSARSAIACTKRC